MKPFARTAARVAVIDRPDIDTDQIIPKQFLKRIERTAGASFSSSTGVLTRTASRDRISS